MFKNSHPFLKISSIFYFSYLDDSNKLAKGIGKFGREVHAHSNAFGRETISFVSKALALLP